MRIFTDYDAIVYQGKFAILSGPLEYLPLPTLESFDLLPLERKMSIERGKICRFVKKDGSHSTRWYSMYFGMDEEMVFRNSIG